MTSADFFTPSPIVNFTNQLILFTIGDPLPPTSDVIYGSPHFLFSWKPRQKMLSEVGRGRSSSRQVNDAIRRSHFPFAIHRPRPSHAEIPLWSTTLHISMEFIAQLLYMVFHQLKDLC